MSCTEDTPCSLCFTIFSFKACELTKTALAKIKANHAVETPIFTKRVFRLHLHSTPIGRRKYVTSALHRQLGMKMTDAQQLARFGGWAPSNGQHADALIVLARQLDRLAKAPIAVVR